MMILSWLSLPLLKKSEVKRFLPSGLFMVLIVKFVNIIARKRKWWWWYEKLHPELPGVFPFMWGPFLIGSLWILKFTYQKFFRYMFLNLIVDSLFTFVLVDWLTKLGIASLVRLKKIQLSLIFLILSVVLYGLQMGREKCKAIYELRFRTL